jgi:carbon-monoxide dehydrogenase small subunit
MSDSEQIPVTMTVNGKKVQRFVEPRTLLIHFMREELNLTGPHIGCETSHCGAAPSNERHVGQVLHHVRRPGERRGAHHHRRPWPMPTAPCPRFRKAFARCTACSAVICTPGMIMRAHVLLKENPNPTEEEIRMGISGNLCRCTGYQNIVKAIQYAAAKLNGPSFRRLQNERHDPDTGTARSRPRRHGLQAQAR